MKAQRTMEESMPVGVAPMGVPLDQAPYPEHGSLCWNVNVRDHAVAGVPAGGVPQRWRD